MWWKNVLRLDKKKGKFSVSGRKLVYEINSLDV